jgi:hypothetical protein
MINKISLQLKEEGFFSCLCSPTLIKSTAFDLKSVMMKNSLQLGKISAHEASHLACFPSVSFHRCVLKQTSEDASAEVREKRIAEQLICVLDA